MTDWVATLTAETEKLLSMKFDVRDGTVVPDSEDVTLADGAVNIEAAFLYADLAASSKLAQVCPWDTTAKIIRAYLNCCVRLIKAWGGEVRSFDGDRVMGVFIGDRKNTNATSCAREIFWMAEQVIGPKATANFKSVREAGIKVRQCVGIDTGNARAVRSGIRNNNDLVWIGRPPSLAAKLSDIREWPYCVYISDACFKKLNAASTQHEGKPLWEERGFDFGQEKLKIHRTSWMKKP